MGSLMKKGHHQGYFQHVAPFAKICLVFFVIPNTCIDQEVIVSMKIFYVLE